jgi:hypothetical protein
LKKSATLILFLAFFTAGNCFGQFSHWYAVQKQNKEKYFLSIGYGWGQANWFSTLSRSSIYDKNGSTLETGDFKFRAKNTTSFYDVNVLCPVSYFLRMGLGMNFERFYLTKLELRQSVTTSKVVIFDESFRFDKIYAQFEYIFWPDARAKFSLSTNFKVGFFSFNNVDRINLFGDDALASSMFFALSPVADAQLYPGFYLFIQPMGEYKYFKNPGVEPGGQVVHNIFTYSAMIGLRIDPNVIDDYK